MANNSIIQFAVPEKILETQDRINQIYNLTIKSEVGELAKKQLESTAQHTKAMVDGVISMIETNLAAMIDEGFSNLYAAIGLNEETISVARSIIKMANNATNLLSSAVMRGLQLMNSIDAQAIPPDPLGAILPLTMTIADRFFSEFIKKYQELIRLLILAINDPDAALLVLKESAITLINMIFDMIDEQVYLYTGLHIIEIYHKCTYAYNMFKMYKKSKKAHKKASKKSGYEANVDIDVNVSFDSIRYKALMEEWLEEQSDAIYNAFMITQIIDTVNNVKTMFNNMTDINLETLADNINELDDVIQLLDELGLGDDSTAIDLSMVGALNINSIVNGLSNIQNNVMNIANSAAQSAINNTVSSVNINVKASASISKTYDVKTNPNDASLTFIFYKNPTEKNIVKDIYNLLTETKNADNTKMFSIAQSKAIQDTITKLYNDYQSSQKTEDKLQVGRYTIIIKLDLDNKQSNLANLSNNISIGNNRNTVPEEDTEEVPEKPVPLNAQINITPNLEIVDEISKTEEQIEAEREQTRRNTIALLHMLFSILKSIFPMLKTFATIISWYKINKAYAQQKSHDNLYAIYQETMAKLGMNKCINLYGTSVNADNIDSENNTELQVCVYTVRTWPLYKYIKETLKLITDSSKSIFDITEDNANEINEWLSNNDSNATLIEIRNEIKIFIDTYSINQHKKCIDETLENTSSDLLNDTLLAKITKDCELYSNGSQNDLENIEFLDDRILYTESTLPLLSSQILMAQRRGIKN